MTFSFADISFILSHPSLGQYSANGTGLGSITVDMTTDRTTHDVAADGVVLVSKIKARNGNVAIEVQQTSDFNNWLLKWFNFLETASSSQWALSSIVISAPVLQQTIVLTSVSPQKQAPMPYKAQGQNVTWTLMAADIQEEPY
jgi:hypothetical protein